MLLNKQMKDFLFVYHTRDYLIIVFPLSGRAYGFKKGRQKSIKELLYFVFYYIPRYLFIQ